MIRLSVLGPSGRMGRSVLALACRAKDIELVAAVDRADSDLIGREVAPGLRATSDLAAAMVGADVYIDFTTPLATRLAAEAATEAGVAAVVGTTGLDAAAVAALERLGKRAPVITAPNFSLGVAVLLRLAEQAARALGDGYDLEVVEIHHRGKRDAPSGTALALARSLAAGRQLDVEKSLRRSRAGDVGPRTDEEIGIVAVRGGDVVGEHTAYLFGECERIEISHRATSRAVFAAGALRAARWIASRAPGRYSMADVLNL